MVEGVHNEDVRVVFSVPQGSVMSPMLFLLYPSDLPMIIDDTHVNNADDST